MFIISTPFHNVSLSFSNNKLSKLSFTSKPVSSIPEDYKYIVDEITEYFINPSHIITVPHELRGTPFQQTVWHALKTIPVGQTITYGELAKKLKTSARAIGQACRHNPIPIVIPCHRVVGTHHLGGFVGQQDGEFLNVKQKLLAHEGNCLK